MKAALITRTGKIVCGINHGIAFAQLTEEERIEVISGFVINNKFIAENKMKELIIIRHGQSKHNVGLTNDLDAEITENGYSQCINTAKYLRKLISNPEEWVGYTSPFLRCLQTSSIISIFNDVRFKIDKRLRENPCLMPKEGLFIPKRSKEFCQFDWTGYEESLICDIEQAEYIKYLQNAIDEMPEKVIIVSHGTTVMTLADIAQGITLEHLPPWNVADPRKWIDNASITHVRYQNLICWGKIAF